MKENFAILTDAGGDFTREIIEKSPPMLVAILQEKLLKNTGLKKPQLVQLFGQMALIEKLIFIGIK